MEHVEKRLMLTMGDLTLCAESEDGKWSGVSVNRISGKRVNFENVSREAFGSLMLLALSDADGGLGAPGSHADQMAHIADAMARPVVAGWPLECRPIR